MKTSKSTVAQLYTFRRGRAAESRTFPRDWDACHCRSCSHWCFLSASYRNMSVELVWIRWMWTFSKAVWRPSFQICVKHICFARSYCRYNWQWHYWICSVLFANYLLKIPSKVPLLSPEDLLCWRIAGSSHSWTRSRRNWGNYCTKDNCWKCLLVNAFNCWRMTYWNIGQRLLHDTVSQ